MTAQFEVFKDIDGEWRWRLRSANGEIVATSESYTREADARRGVDDMRAAESAASPEDVPIIVKAVER